MIDDVTQDDVAASPPETAEAIKDLIKDKVVCDLGCGFGDLLSYLAKYAKKVIGVERYNHRAEIARTRGFEVILGDIFEIDIPKADIYYLWTTNNQQIADRIEKGIIIATRENAKDLIDSTIMEFPYATKTDPKVWHLSIIKK